MRKTFSRVMYFAVLATIICIGCGGDDGQTKSLLANDLFNAITGGGKDTPVAPDVYTLSVSVSPTEGGTVSRSPNASSYAPGTQVTVTATPKTEAGYEFIGWSGDSNSEESSITITMDGNMALSAGFGRIGANLPKYSVYFNSNGATGTPPETILRDSGSVVLLPNQAGLTKEWHSFAGWNTEDDGSGRNYNATDEYTFTQTATLFAKWTRNTYTLTINATTGGTTSRNPNQTTYNAGTDVVVTATAAQDYTFAGWSGASSSTNAAVTIRMDENKTLTPSFRQNTYTLTTNISTDGGGSVSRNPNANSYNPGTEVIVKATPANGYTFTGWTGDTSGTANPVTINLDRNKTITAGFGRIGATRFTVTFNGNGATTGSVPTAETADSGATITLPGQGNLERSGYRFGWWTANNTGTGTKYNAGDSYHVTSGSTLFAKWIPIYTVTFNANGATTGSAPATMSADSSSGVTVPPQGDLSKNGHTFDGWNTRSDGTGTNYGVGQLYIATSNATLYAKWTALSYTVTFNGNGATSDVPAAKIANYGDNITLQSMTRTGYTFNGWYENCVFTGTGYSSGSSYTVTENTILCAKWTAIPYTVTFDGNGATSGVPAAKDANYGDNITLPSMTRTGHTFGGWYENSEYTGIGYTANSSYNVIKDVTLYAKWTPLKHKLTTNVSSAGGGSVSPSNQTIYDYGTKVIVTAMAEDRNTFKEWSGDATGTANPLTITMTQDWAITANFQLTDCPLTIGVSPFVGGSVSRSSNLECGDYVTVTAIAASCYTFIGWSGNFGMTNPLTVKLGETSNLTANFQQNQYTVTTSVSGVSPSSSYGSVSRSPSQTNYICGTSVTLTAMSTNSDIVMFDSWIGVPSGVNTFSNPVTFTINGNMAITAMFKVKKDTTISYSNVGTASYLFNKGFPATVEAYAIGSGGGGAGGAANQTCIGGCTEATTGGAGGGGAVTKAIFKIDNATSFSVTVGKGGTAGKDGGRDNCSIGKSCAGWWFGTSGGDGTSTTVVGGDVTVTAEGGKGGIGGTTSTTTVYYPSGGTGGTGRVNGSVSSSKTITGSSGEAGNSNSSRESIGGNRGGINDSEFSMPKTMFPTHGKGGNGGYDPKTDKNNPGRDGYPGNNGAVIIKFTWWE